MSQKVFFHRKAVVCSIDKESVYFVKSNDEPLPEGHKIPIMLGGYYKAHDTNGEYIVVEPSRVWGSGNFTSLESCRSVDDIMTKPIRVEYQTPDDVVFFGDGRFYMYRKDYEDPKRLGTIPVWAVNELHDKDKKMYDLALENIPPSAQLEPLPQDIDAIKSIAGRVWAQLTDMYKAAKMFQVRDFPESSDRGVVIGFDGFEGYSVGASAELYEGHRIPKYKDVSFTDVRTLLKWLTVKESDILPMICVATGSYPGKYTFDMLTTTRDNLVESIMGRSIGGVKMSQAYDLSPCIMYVPQKLVYSKSTPQRAGLTKVSRKYSDHIKTFMGESLKVMDDMVHEISCSFKITGSILEYVLCEKPSVYDEQFKNSDVDCLFTGSPKEYNAVYQYFLERSKTTGLRVQKIVSCNTGYYKFKVTVPNGRTLEIYPSTTRSIIGYHSPTCRGYLDAKYSFDSFDPYLTPSAESAYATGIITHVRWILVGKNSIDVVLKRIRRGFKFMASPVEAEKLRASMGDDYAECDFPEELKKYVAVDSDGELKYYKQLTKYKREKETSPAQFAGLPAMKM